MHQPERPDGTDPDVLSMGEGRSTRWGLLGTALLVVVLGLGTYRLVSSPETPAASQPAAAAQDRPSAAFAGSEGFGRHDERSRGGAMVRLGGDVVALRGPDVQQPERETSAAAVGRIPGGWLVKLTSVACEGRADRRTVYGVARASGHFIPWQSPWAGSRNPGGAVWRSPDRTLVLVVDRRRLEVRRISTGTMVAELATVR